MLFRGAVALWAEEAKRLSGHSREEMLLVAQGLVHMAVRTFEGGTVWDFKVHAFTALQDGYP
jgi:hypothetical protein